MRYSFAAALILTAQETVVARNAAKPWEDKSKGGHGKKESKYERFNDFAEAIGYWGYGWEPYYVTTRDGFKLTLFRITEAPPDDFIKPELPISSSSESEHEYHDPIPDESEIDPASDGIEEAQLLNLIEFDMGKDDDD